MQENIIIILVFAGIVGGFLFIGRRTFRYLDVLTAEARKFNGASADMKLVAVDGKIVEAKTGDAADEASSSWTKIGVVEVALVLVLIAWIAFQIKETYFYDRAPQNAAENLVKLVPIGEVQAAAHKEAVILGKEFKNSRYEETIYFTAAQCDRRHKEVTGLPPELWGPCSNANDLVTQLVKNEQLRGN